MGAVSTSSRLLSLLSLLQARRDWPGAVLASRLQVSPRTLRRDVDRLRGLGYRITAAKGPDGGYRLDAGSELPPLRFDDEQVVALAVALQTASSAGTAVGEAAERALATVRQVLPSHLRHRVDSIQVAAVRTPGTQSAAVTPEVLFTLSAAIQAHQMVRFDYLASDLTAEAAAEARPREVDPHHLLSWGGRWYLIAWDPGRDGWRIFRIDRLALRSSLGPRFTPRVLPGGDPGAFISARFKGSQLQDAWPCIGQVTLALPASQVAPFVDDGLVEDLGNDRCRLALGSWSWTSLAAAIGRFDADIEVLGPPELTQAFARLADRFTRAATTGAPQRTDRRQASRRPWTSRNASETSLD
ncbi:MAG: helix-turn-helix transcriptional regulator [Propionicimonas sp.]